jgi:hypothetical protein
MLASSQPAGWIKIAAVSESPPIRLGPKTLFCNGPLGVNPFRADPIAGISLLSGVGVLGRHLMVSD